MKYAIYEDPIAHRFAHLPLPSRFLDGDELPAVVTDRWFESHDTALAGLAELLDREDSESASTADAAMGPDAGEPQQMNSPPRPFVSFKH
jgi:hypothetical protein